MFFWACILVPPPGLKISFSNRLALSTKLCVVLLWKFNIPSSFDPLHKVFTFLPLLYLFVLFSFFFPFVHSPLFMIWTLLLCWLAIFSASTCSAIVSLATSCVCWGWNWFWSISPVKVWNYVRVISPCRVARHSG